MHSRNQVQELPEHLSPSPWVDSNWLKIILSVIILLGAFFRLAGLGNKIYSHDEAYTSLHSAGFSGSDVLNRIGDGKDHSAAIIQKYLQPSKEKNIIATISVMTYYEPQMSPLFFIIEHYWMRIIGYSPAAMRGLAAVFGLLSIPGMYWFSKELYQSQRIALLATAFFAISPFQILIAQDARPYSLLTLVILLSSLALFQAIRKDNILIWLIYALTLILGLYSHQLFALIIVVHGIYFLIIRFLRVKTIPYGILLAYGLAGIAFLPWLYWIITRWPYIARLMEWTNMQTSWYRYIQRWLLIFSSPVIDLDLLYGNLLIYFLRALLLMFITFGFFFVVLRTQPRVWLFLLLTYIVTAGTIMGADLLLGGIRSTSGRYFVPANIISILVIAKFIGYKLDQAGKKQNVKWGLFTCCLFILSIISNLNSLTAETWWNKELGRIRPEFVKEINQDQTLLIISGRNPTNLGDLLLLGMEIDADVHFTLYPDPNDINYPKDYAHTYWFPSSPDHVHEIAVDKQFQVSEKIPGILWRISEDEP